MPGDVLLDAGLVSVASPADVSAVIDVDIEPNVRYWLAYTLTSGSAKGRGTGNFQYGGSGQLFRDTMSGIPVSMLYLTRTGGVGNGAALISVAGRNDFISITSNNACAFVRIGALT